eukprot:5310308-Pleurochrysis_carterae.AAC.1
MAIVDTIAAEPDATEGEKPTAYVADAERAYRFCPVQHADCWLQCFIWWDAEGRAGVVVDRRL